MLPSKTNYTSMNRCICPCGAVASVADGKCLSSVEARIRWLWRWPFPASGSSNSLAAPEWRLPGSGLCACLCIKSRSNRDKYRINVGGEVSAASYPVLRLQDLSVINGRQRGHLASDLCWVFCPSEYGYTKTRLSWSP